MLERQIDFDHTEKEKQPEINLPGLNRHQLEFLICAVKLGLFSQLDERTKKLIIIKAQTNQPLDSLRPVEVVRTLS